MSKYSEDIDSALESISEAGQAIPISRSLADFDPVAGEAVNKVSKSGTMHGVVLPASKGTVQAFDNRILEDTSLTRIRFIIAAAKGLPFEPLAGDILTLEGSQFVIAGSTPLAPDGTPIIYNIGAKKL